MGHTSLSNVGASTRDLRETRSHHWGARVTQKRGIYGRHAAWPITCPSLEKNSKYRCGNNEQVCAQGTVPPPPPPSPPPFPSQLPSYLTRLTSVCLLVCCLSPSWECPLPKSRNLAWLAHPLSPRGLRPSLAGRYIPCGMFFLGPGQESWLQKQVHEKR